MRIGRRVAMFLMFLLLLVFSVIRAGQAGQQPQTGAATAAEDTFTGKSWRIDNQGVSLSRRGFEPAARSDWHSHGGAQVIYVQEGRMRYQIEGQPMKELGAHESTYLPGSVPHWHGAVPKEIATQLSLTYGAGIKWMEKVNDQQYAGKAKR
jgi:quercetin dioxygenase-like cupin family protein